MSRHSPLAAEIPDGDIDIPGSRVGTGPGNDKMENSLRWQRKFL
jgi:hypothetical protein